MNTPLSQTLGLLTAQAEHPRDKLSRMLSLVRARRTATGASTRSQHAGCAYRARALVLALRASARTPSHPGMVAHLARIACIVGPDAPIRHAVEVVARMVHARTVLAAMTGADQGTLALALDALASKGGDPGSASRRSVTVPAGLALPDYIAHPKTVRRLIRKTVGGVIHRTMITESIGTWYAADHLAPGRYEWSAVPLATLEAWGEGLDTRERTTEILRPRPQSQTPDQTSAQKITRARKALVKEARAVAELWSLHNASADRLETLEDCARTAPTGTEAREHWSKASRLAGAMRAARDRITDRTTRLAHARTWLDVRTMHAPGEPITRISTPDREGRGGVRTYSPSREQRVLNG